MWRWQTLQQGGSWTSVVCKRRGGKVVVQEFLRVEEVRSIRASGVVVARCVWGWYFGC